MWLTDKGIKAAGDKDRIRLQEGDTIFSSGWVKRSFRNLWNRINIWQFIRKDRRRRWEK